MKIIIRHISNSLVFIILAGILVLPLNTRSVMAATTMPALMISELQVAGLKVDSTINGSKEFIELYNPTEKSLVLDGLRLEYLSATHDGSVRPTRQIALLQGKLSIDSFYLLSAEDYLPDAQQYFSLVGQDSGMMASGGGYVRIVNAQDEVIDFISWGTAKPVGSWWHASSIKPGMSVQRIIPKDPTFVEPGYSYLPPSDAITPGAPYAVKTDLQCSKVMISEVLPNAAGPDAGHEFIELYNPLPETISLKGCSLQLGDSKSFNLPDERLPSGTYRSFTDVESGLSLPNAIPQPLRIVTELTALNSGDILYPANISENLTWALINDDWAITSRPTPGLANILLEPPLRNQPQEPSPVCEAGKERNPDTGRCRNIASVSIEPDCKTGQLRNPETGRCKTIRAQTTTAALIPCQAGQYRNVETNRCRSSASDTELAVCRPGQERNLETNRCRKVFADPTTQLAAIQDVASTSSSSQYHWWIAAAAVTIAVSYGVYEWRHDMMARWRSRQKPKDTPKS